MASLAKRYAGPGILALIGVGIDVDRFIPEWFAFVVWGIALIWAAYWIIGSRLLRHNKIVIIRDFGKRIARAPISKGYYDYAMESKPLIRRIDGLVADIDSEMTTLAIKFYEHVQLIKRAQGTGKLAKIRDAFQKAGNTLSDNVEKMELIAAQLGRLVDEHQGGVTYIAKGKGEPGLSWFNNQDIAEAKAIQPALSTRKILIETMCAELRCLVEPNRQQNFTQGMVHLVDVLQGIADAFSKLNDTANVIIKAAESGVP